MYLKFNKILTDCNSSIKKCFPDQTYALKYATESISSHSPKSELY